MCQNASVRSWSGQTRKLLSSGAQDKGRRMIYKILGGVVLALVNAVTVIVEFSESSGKTKVTVTEVGIPLIVKFLSAVAWDQQFDKIEGLL